MLPSSHSVSGRWTWRSTARTVTSASTCDGFGAHDDDRISHPDQAAFEDPAVHPSTSDECLLEPGPDLVHPKTGLADRRQLENGGTNLQPGTGLQPHDPNPFDGQILLDGARIQFQAVDIFPVRQQHLPPGCGTGVMITPQPQSRLGHSLVNPDHRLAMPGTELDRGHPGRHRFRISDGLKLRC